MNIVFDTNVLISATLWYESSAQKVLKRILKEGYLIYSSVDIIAEYHKVLKRDFSFSEDKINFFLSNILSFLNITKPIEKIDIVKDDPDDNKILECALESKSDYILTYDKHLLNLKQYEKIKIVTPENFLDILSS